MAAATESVHAASEPIEIDQTLDDGASSIGDQLSAFTESLTSSVLDHRFEHGRRYHRYRSGAYPFPNDETEMDRLDLIHEVMFRALGEKLYLAPVEKEKVKRILDVGTGTGIWAISIAEMFPDTEVLGNDLSPIQPTWVPPNIKFEVDDVESPWVYAQKFDWVFCRYMTSCIQDWPQLVQNAFDNLNPGGYAEFQDFDIRYYSEDGSLSDDAEIQRWIAELRKASDNTGREMNPGPKLDQWMRAAGFQDVKRKRMKLPLGPWPRDRRLKELGLFNLTQFEQGLEGFSLHLLLNVLKWEREAVYDTIAKIRKEIRDPKIHILYDFYAVYGRKPE